MRESIQAVGNLRLEVYEYAGGPLLHVEEGRNLITNIGFSLLAGLLSGDQTSPVHYIAIGTTNTAAAASDTALAAEITTNGGARALGTADRTTTTQTNDTARVRLTYTFTGSFAIVEAGLFDAASAGNMLSRRVFSAVNVVNGNVVVATWTVKFA